MTFRPFRYFRQLFDVVWGTPAEKAVPSYDATAGKLAMRTLAQAGIAGIDADVTFGAVGATGVTAPSVTSVGANLILQKAGASVQIGPKVAGSTNIVLTPEGAGTVQVTSGLSATSFTGSGSGLTNIPAAQLTGTIPSANLPAVAITDTWVVGSQAAMLALTAQRGDVAVRSDVGKSYILSTDSPGTLADWVELAAAGAVTSVAGRSGNVALASSDLTDASNLPKKNAANAFANVNTFSADATNHIPVNVKRVAGQTADLEQWRDENDTILASMSKDGLFNPAGGITTNGNATVGGNLSAAGTTVFTGSSVGMNYAGIARFYINSQTGSPNTGFVLQENGAAKWTVASYGGGQFTCFNNGLNTDGFTLNFSTNAIAFFGALSAPSANFAGNVVLGNSGAKWDNTNGRMVLGANTTAQLLNLYESGTSRFGLGVQAGELRLYSPSGGIINFGYVSTSDGATWTTVSTFASTSPFYTLNGSPAPSAVGVETQALYVRRLNGGQSYPDVLEIKLGRHTTTGDFSPATRVDFAVKSDASATLAGDVTPLTIRSDMRVIQGAASSAPTDANIPANAITFYLDESGNNLKVRVRYAGGTYKTGTLALT